MRVSIEARRWRRWSAYQFATRQLRSWRRAGKREVLLAPRRPAAVPQVEDQAAHWDLDVGVGSFAYFQVVTGDEVPSYALRRWAKDDVQPLIARPKQRSMSMCEASDGVEYEGRSAKLDSPIQTPSSLLL